MFNVISSVGRSWPAYDFHVKLGENQFEKLTEGQTYFLQPFVDAGLMVVYDDTADRTPEQKAKLEDTIGRVRKTASEELKLRGALEAQAQSQSGKGASRLDGSVDLAALAKSESDAKSKGGGKG